MLLGKLLGCSVAQDVEALGIGLHQAVFDSVVYHFHEMARSRRAAMEIPFLGRPPYLLASRRARDVTASGRQGLENGIKPPHGFQRAADHKAVTPVNPPDASARAHVQIMNAFSRELLRSPHVVFII